MLYNYRFLDGLGQLGQQLFHTAKDILHRAHFAQILCLQFCKFLGHIVGIDTLVAGNQVLILILCHQLQIAAPLVFDPNCVEVFIVRTKDQHDFSGIQCCKDIRLILHTQLIFQRDTGEENTISLVGQCVVNILRQYGVQCPVAFFIGLLIANKNVVGSFLGGYLDNALSNFFDGLGFVPVDPASKNIGIFQRLLQVRVVHHTFKGGTVAGRDLLAGSRVIHILNAVFTQH